LYKGISELDRPLAAIVIKMKKYIYLISFFVLILVFSVVFIVVSIKVSNSKYEELLKREAHGLPDSRSITLMIRVKPNQSKDELENTLQYAYANELMNQIRKKQTLKKIVVNDYFSAIDFQKNPDTTWKARLEKIGEEKERLFFPDESDSTGSSYLEPL
jgi:hypothetical protein